MEIKKLKNRLNVFEKNIQQKKILRADLGM